MKPDYLLDKEVTLQKIYKFVDYTDIELKNGGAACILDFCQKHKIHIRNHILLWYSKTLLGFLKKNMNGNWVNKDKLLKTLENSIKTVFDMMKSIYSKANFYARDVVNEVWEYDGKPKKSDVQEEGNGIS